MWLTYAAMQPALPHLRLESIPQVHQAGSVPQGSVSAEFQLWNRTEEPIRIAHVVQTCRCTETAIHKKELGPGNSTKLYSTWDTTGLRGASSSGLEVYYSVGDQPGLKSVPLLIEADVIPEFDYSPTRLEFSVGEEETSVVKFSRHASATRDVKVLRAISSHPAFRVVSVANWSVEIAFDPSKWPDDPHLRAKLTVTTDCPTEKVVEVPLCVQSRAQR